MTMCEYFLHKVQEISSKCVTLRTEARAGAAVQRSLKYYYITELLCKVFYQV